MAKSYITEPFGGNTGANPMPLCRISYAHGLHTINDDGKYSVTLIIPKNDIKVLQSKVAEVVKGEWSEKGVERFKNGLIKNPILAGDGKSARNKTTGELHPGLGPDVVLIRPWTKKPVPVFGLNALPMDASEIQSGWWGYPILVAFAWHNAEQGDGVGFWINGWMHGKEDEVIGGAGSVDPNAFFKSETVDTGDTPDVGSGGAGDMFA